MAHGGLSGEILTDELAQDAIAFAVEDTDTLHAHEHSIIDEVAYGLQRLVTTHTPHVEVWMEVLAMIVNGALCHLRHVVSLQPFLDSIHLALRFSRSIGGLLLLRDKFKTRHRHLRTHIADEDCCCFSGQLLHCTL